MKTLILMRHSHATSNNSAYSDHERPLTDEGRRLAKTSGQVLFEWQVDQVICSSATRSLETATEVVKSVSTIAQPTVSKELYLASPGVYGTVAAKLGEPDDKVLLLIGHNPGLAELINRWTNEPLSIFPATAAAFRLRIDDWTQLATRGNLTKELVGVVSEGIRIR